MFRKITSLLILAAAAISAAAQDNDMGLGSNERVIGYTVTNDIDVTNGAFGQAGTYSLGAYMYASDLKAYAGCRILGIRIAAGMDLGRARTFLYTIEENQMTLTHEQRQRIYEGWNPVYFNGDGFTIEEGKDLFFGYDYTETEEMVAADQGGIAATGYDTDGSTMLLAEDTLYPLSGVGRLCVQLIIDVTNMQPYEITYGFFDTGFKYKQTDEEIMIMATINNVGRDNISTLRMGWQYDDMAPQYADLAVNMPSGGNYTWNQVLTPPAPLGIGSHNLRVFPAQADGTEIPASELNTRYENIAVYSQTVPRDKVLLEVFTNTSNVGSIGIHSIINQLGDADGTSIVAMHHFPGTPLATPESQPLFERYAYTSPVFTIDRAYFPGEAYIAYSANDFLGLLPDDLIVSMFKEMAAQDIESPCFASLSASGQCNADNSLLDLEVTIDALPDAAAIYGTLAAHVMLVEDGVKSAQAATGIGGRPIINNNYTHNNVVRLNHTGIKGQPVTLENNAAKLKFSVPMDPSWNPANMRAVVYLTKYFDEETPTNLKDYDVINATAISIGAIASISNVAADGIADGPSAYYTIGGVPVDGDNLAPGLYIERRADGSARKILVK